MKDDRTQQLRDLVDASGFVFQLGVEQRVKETADKHGWAVLSREHAWTYADTGGFVDLLLGRSNLRLVVECKRPRDAVWAFLVPEGRVPSRRVKCHWANLVKGQHDIYGWDDVDTLPASPESDFCVVRGQGEGDRPMLERLCWSVIDSFWSLAHEEMCLLRGVTEATVIHIPVIVTTASLEICRFDSANVDLKGGRLPSNVRFESVPFVRFRKSLARALTPHALPRSLADAARDKERTVLVSRHRLVFG